MSHDKSPTRWHYTVGDYLEQILAEGMLRPAATGLPLGVRPAVWFSVNPDWDDTANLRLRAEMGIGCPLTKEETRRWFGGLARVGVGAAAAPYDWEAFQQLGGAPEKFIKALCLAAAAVGSRPQEWYVSFAPVPRALWRAVQVHDGGCWRPVQGWQTASKPGGEAAAA